MTINFELLKAIREKGLRQYEFAQIVREDKTMISRIINGVWLPSETQKIKYARALGKKPDELFGGIGR